jgi:hypothetical protein
MHTGSSKEKPSSTASLLQLSTTVPYFGRDMSCGHSLCVHEVGVKVCHLHHHCEPCSQESSLRIKKPLFWIRRQVKAIESRPWLSLPQHLCLAQDVGHCNSLYCCCILLSSLLHCPESTEQEDGTTLRVLWFCRLSSLCHTGWSWWWWKMLYIS